MFIEFDNMKELVTRFSNINIGSSGKQANDAEQDNQEILDGINIANILQQLGHTVSKRNNKSVKLNIKGLAEGQVPEMFVNDTFLY